MTLKYMPIKSFFTEFSHMKYMKWGGLYLLALYNGIIISLTQHPKNYCIDNQRGAGFFISKALGFTSHSGLC